MKPLLMPLNGKEPSVGEKVFLAPTAQLIGDVTIGDGSSVWFNTVLRGDVFPIVVGEETNIQDGCVLHGTYNKCGVVLGNRVTVGHSVILHGCEIGDATLIGMGSCVMDMAKIPKNCVVGAGSLVTEESTFEEGDLILGRPAKAVRKLREGELAFLEQSADNYIHYKSWYAGENI